MKTRFSLSLAVTEPEAFRLFQVFEYLSEFADGRARVSRELADHLGGDDTSSDLPERRFADLIGTGPPGIDIIAEENNRVQLFDEQGAPDLRMLYRIIANVVPRVLPLEFSFASVDDQARRYSGGLVVMTTTAAEIHTIASMVARRGGQLLH